MTRSALFTVLIAGLILPLTIFAEGTNETSSLFGITITQTVSKAETLFSEGCAYQTGNGGEQDMVQAAKCFREAADLGHAQAQYNYGTLCLQGAIEGADEQEALKWLTKSAKQGTQQAYYLVGLCHYNLEAYTEAYAWALMAESAGDTRLKETLEPMYSEEEIAAGKARFEELKKLLEKKSKKPKSSDESPTE